MTDGHVPYTVIPRPQEKAKGKANIHGTKLNSKNWLLTVPQQ